MPGWALLATLGGATAFATPVRADLHLDTPSQLLAQNLPLDAPTGLEAGLVQLRAGGTNLAVMVLWPPRKADHKAHSFALLDRLDQEIGRIDGVEKALHPSGARALIEAGNTAVLISLEGAHGLGDGPWEPVFDELHRRGLRVLGLSWSFSNRFAGSSGDQGGGLTDAGRALVQRAQGAGVLIDLSHASRQTTLEVCQATPVPVIASHSNAFRQRGHARNLTDEEIRCIAEKGGVIGLNFHAPFVGLGADVAQVADQADALAQVGGHGVVALGSDFDGFIQTPKGLEDASKLGALWAELARRGWTEAQLEGLRGENFMRAWTRAWEGRQGAR